MSMITTSPKIAVFCLMGVTASGKTRLAIELTKRMPVDIVSVDSGQVYRGLDIGTAKPSHEELLIAPHRLINICDPKESYSGGMFFRDAQREIAYIHANQRIPMLVGGTMFYFHLLQQGFTKIPNIPSCYRKRINTDMLNKGLDIMHQKLKTVDPQAAARIHPHDTQRIQRALEIFEGSGQCLTSWQDSQHIPPPAYRIINFILSPTDRNIAHDRITKRFDAMLTAGLVEEVSSLYERSDLSTDMPSIRMVGYRQVWDYLAGKYDFTTMREKAIFSTKRVTKRQLTWLRRFKDATWFDSESPDLLVQVLQWMSLELKNAGQQI